MKTKIITTLLSLFFITIHSYSQDFLNFTAVESEGYGAYATNFGHTIPIGGICGLNVAYSSLVSAEQAPSASFPNMNAGLKLATGGTGFTNLKQALTDNGYAMTDVEMIFSSMTLGSDVQNQDWFVIGTNETRFYQNGTFTFQIDNIPIVSGSMPVLQIEIAYNTVGNCSDDVISGLTQYTSIADASGGQLQKYQDIAAAFLLDVGTKGIRFNFGNMEPAAQGVNDAVFEATTGKIELGETFDGGLMGATISEPTTGICTSPSVQVTSSGSGNWLHVLNSGSRVVSILDSENMGSITTQFYINNAAVRSTSGGLEYMDRNFTITPTTQPSGNIRVRLYFTDTEWTSFIGASPDNFEFMSEFTITKFTSSDCTGISNASGEVTVSLLDYGYITSDNAYFVDIQVSSFSTFFIHGPKSGNILPVELISFTGHNSENGIQLEWQTASEKNNEGFSIERSTDGFNWENIGFIQGNGTTQETHEYHFVDEIPQLMNYYRLKQMDFNGQFEYSHVVNIDFRGTKASLSEVQVFPNPVLDELNIISSPGSAIIYNVLGQPIRQFLINNEQSVIDVSDLAEGQYMLQVQQENGNIITKQFVK